ncbi:sarcoplasmic calcium-binding protein-like [Lingula anatina]|uniref:Sarcoplasmic calcium-binding protein-like n=1 Tax=Lingula anatina TaxID=7574 RepID=A0A1S3INU7_LINAN|nr:sarcoplasmic calcium-binding protein-like [Lingula anatina]|eukprot:XP_013399748.1 sarcoplasmic calcium-binding protein-like [Lingula anatina]
MEVTKQEYVDAVVDRICQYMDREMAGILAPMWTYTWQRFWYNGGPRGRKTVDEMIKDHRYALSSRLYVHSAATWLRIAFDTVLARGKEVISLDEYSLFLKCFDVHPLSAKFAFHSLDTNHDNLLSKEEFINGGRLFFTASNSTVGDHFWGPMLA